MTQEDTPKISLNDNEETKASHTSPFEAICREAEDGSEYWSARELGKILGYTEYSKFQNAMPYKKLKQHVRIVARPSQIISPM